MKLGTFRAAAALGVLLPLLAACGGNGSANDGLRVVTSFYPLRYVADRVAGDQAEVTNLTKPGLEPHDTELSIRQTADLAEADLVFYEKGLATAVDDAVDTAGPDHVVDAAKYARIEDDDPHFWLDVSRLVPVAEAFERELADVDPDHAQDYDDNLTDLKKDLLDLDTELRATLRGCTIKDVVVSHDAFTYFGKRYGLSMHPINGLSPEAEPSPEHLAELHQLIDRFGITTVFFEELTSSDMAKSLASDLGLETAVLDPVEGLSDETADEDYVSLMRKNLAALTTADDC